MQNLRAGARSYVTVYVRELRFLTPPHGDINFGHASMD